MTIEFSKFCFDTFFKEKSLNPEKILSEINKNFKKSRKGYRDGVILVPIDPKGFKCPIVHLKDGMTLIGKFRPRVNGEEPRKKVCVPNVKESKANYVDVVLYRKDVLEETRETSTKADWEVITILPKLDKDQPMDPTTLCYNHFRLSGGTKTNMNDSEFVRELKKSFVYWKDKAMVY